MVGILQPLDQKFAIVDTHGNPTDYFIRWAQQKQIDIEGAITADQAIALIVQYLDEHRIQEGTGIQITPSGNLTDEPVISADVQEILDQITATRGAIIYRGLLGWAALLPGTAGYLLSTNGAGADPTWIAPSGGGGHPWYWAPPLAADFPTLASGDATNVTLTDDTDVGLIINNQGSVGADRVRGAFRALASSGAADWTATMHVVPWNDGTGSQNSGGALIARESGTGKILQMGALFGNRIDGYRGTMTAYTAQVGSAKPGFNLPWWYRIRYTHATALYETFESANGKTWIINGSVAAATAFTVRADQIGIGFNNNAAGRNPSCSVDNFSLV